MTTMYCEPPLDPKHVLLAYGVLIVAALLYLSAWGF